MKPTVNYFGTVSAGNEDVRASVNPITGSASIGTSQNVVDSGDVKVDVGASIGTGGVNVSPRVQIGEGQGAATGASAGATVGGLAGSTFGPLGAAAGSTIGSAAGSVVGGQFNPSQKSLEHDRRNGVRNAFVQAGYLDSNKQFLLPDGHIADFNFDNQQGLHDWKNPDKRVDKNGDRPLFAYEIDYTNDLDYIAGMAGITLSRILGGGTKKEIDQIGNQMGNQLLGKLGHGKDLTEENFKHVMTNARAFYAKAGIQTKDDALALANDMFGGGRISDADYAVMQQTANLVFDSDFKTAQGLMGGRWKGIETATRSPSDSGGLHQNRPGRIYSPILSPEEAMLSVQPYFDWYRQNVKKPKKTSSTAATISGGLQAVTGVIGLYNQLNNITGGAISEGIQDLWNGDPGESPVEPVLPGFEETGIGESLSEGDFGFDTTGDYLSSADF